MKTLCALMFGAVVGTLPAMAQTSSTSTFTKTADGYQSSTTYSDGSSRTITRSGSTITTTYQPRGSGYMPMGRSGYHPMGN